MGEVGKQGGSVLRRGMRWGWRVVAVAAVVGVVGFVGLQWGVRAGLRKVMGDLGLGGATYQVEMVTPWRAAVTGVSLGEGKGGVGGVSAEFSPWEAIRGKVRVVRVSGAEVRVDLRGEQVKVVGLPEMGGGGGGVDLGLLPEAMELTGSVVTVVLPGGEVVLPVRAEWKKGGTGGGGTVAATVKLGTDEAVVLAAVDGAGHWTVTGSGKLSLGQAARLAPAGVLPPELLVAGDVALAGAGDLSAKTFSGSARVEGAGVTWFGLGTVRDLGVEATVQSGPEGVSGKVTVSGLARSVDTRVGAMKFMVEGALDGEVMTGTGAVMGDVGSVLVKSWRLRRSGGGGGGEVSGGGEVEFSLTPPLPILNQLAAMGIQVSEVGAIVGKGDVVYLGGAGGMATVRVAECALGAGAVVVRGAAGDIRVSQPRVLLSGATGTVAAGVTSLVVDRVTVESRGARGPGWEVSWGDESMRGLQVVAGGLSATQSAGGEGGGGAGGGGGLRVASNDISVLLSPATVRVEGGGGVQLGGVEGVLKGTGVYSPDDGAKVLLNADSLLKVASVKADDGGWSAAQVGVQIRPRSAVAPMAITTTMPNTQPTTMASTAEGSAQGSAASTAATTVPTTGPASAPTTAPTTVPVWESAGLAWSPRRGVEVQGRIVVAGTEISSKAFKVAVGEASADGAVWMAPGEAGPSVEGRVSVLGVDVKNAELGLSILGGRVELPVSIVEGKSPKPEEGSLSVEAMEYRGKRLPGVTGTVFVTREGAWAGLEWPLLSEGVVKARGHVDVSGKVTTADLEAWIPAFDFTKADELRSLLPVALGDADIRGTFSGQVRYFIGPDQTVRWGEVEVKDGTLRSTAVDAELTGINGRVWTRSFSPLETPAGQTLSVERARLGKFEVEKGKVDFRLDPGDIVFVESAVFGFAGGEVSARGWRVQPGRGAADLVLYADNVDIGRLAEKASGGKVSGSGRLYARLPVRVVWPERVNLGTGYVYAEASGVEGAKGSLRLVGFATQIGDLVGQSMGDGGGTQAGKVATAQVKQRVTSALVDFGFNSLTLDVTKEQDKPLTLTVKTSGKGPSEPGTGKGPTISGQELNLTFNVTGLEELVNRYLGLKGAGIGF